MCSIGLRILLPSSTGAGSPCNHACQFVCVNRATSSASSRGRFYRKQRSRPRREPAGFLDIFKSRRCECECQRKRVTHCNGHDHHHCQARALLSGNYGNGGSRCGCHVSKRISRDSVSAEGYCPAIHRDRDIRRQQHSRCFGRSTVDFVRFSCRQRRAGVGEHAQHRFYYDPGHVSRF